MRTMVLVYENLQNWVINCWQMDLVNLPAPFGWPLDTMILDSAEMAKSVRMINIIYQANIAIEIWLVVWKMFHFPIYWECHHPN